MINMWKKKFEKWREYIEYLNKWGFYMYKGKEYGNVSKSFIKVYTRCGMNGLLNMQGGSVLFWIKFQNIHGALKLNQDIKLRVNAKKSEIFGNICGLLKIRI